MGESNNLIAIIANRFSVIYGSPRMFGPCACMGASCGNLACETWWDIVLQDEEIRAMAINIYSRHKDEIENGVGDLLKKRFLDVRLRGERIV